MGRRGVACQCVGAERPPGRRRDAPRNGCAARARPARLPRRATRGPSSADLVARSARARGGRGTAVRPGRRGGAAARRGLGSHPGPASRWGVPRGRGRGASCGAGPAAAGPAVSTAAARGPPRPVGDELPHEAALHETSRHGAPAPAPPARRVDAAVFYRVAGRRRRRAEPWPPPPNARAVRRECSPGRSRASRLARCPWAAAFPLFGGAVRSAPGRRPALEQAADALRAALRAEPRLHHDPERLAARPRDDGGASAAGGAFTARARGAPFSRDGAPGLDAGRACAGAGGCEA